MAQTYEKLGEAESAVEEYVKLAYKYPGDELIPSVMARLGDYFQKKGQAIKEKADAIRDKTDEASKGEVIVLDEASYPEFLKAARVFEKLYERFPEDPLAPLSGIRAGQNFMRAHQYDRAAKAFEKLPEVADIADALRLAVRHFPLGDDMLFDLAIERRIPR